MLPSAEHIRNTESKPRPLVIDPWVAAHLSRFWKTISLNIQASIAAYSSTRGQAHSSETPIRSSAGTQEQHHIAQSAPASSQNRS